MTTRPSSRRRSSSSRRIDALMCRVACSYVELPLGANHEVVKARERHALAGTGARVPVLQLLYLRTIEPRVVLEPPPGRTSAWRGAAGARGEPAEEVLEQAPRVVRLPERAVAEERAEAAGDERPLA